MVNATINDDYCNYTFTWQFIMILLKAEWYSTDIQQGEDVETM